MPQIKWEGLRQAWALFELRAVMLLSHGAKDKAVVRDVAERLKKDGRMRTVEVRRTKAKVPLHPSAFKLHPFPDWAQLESGTFQMQGHHALRDPLNKERRFLPLRLDDAPIKDSLGQSLPDNRLLNSQRQLL